MRWWQRLTIMAGMLVLTGGASAQLAELVWAQAFPKQHKLFHSTWDGKHWSKPEIIKSADHAMATPVLSVRSDGSKLLIWSQQVKQKSVLMLSSLQDKSKSWSPSIVLSRLGIENVSPSIVRDLTGNVWVFWAADLGSYSDVFYVKQNLEGWSEPLRVNNKNEVPDIKPLGRLNALGEVMVTWQSYDFDVGDYQDQKFVFRNASTKREGLSTSIKKPHETSENDVKIARLDPLDPADLELPDFLPLNITASIYVPVNKYSQIVRVNQGYIQLGE